MNFDRSFGKRVVAAAIASVTMIAAAGWNPFTELVKETALEGARK